MRHNTVAAFRTVQHSIVLLSSMEELVQASGGSQCSQFRAVQYTTHCTVRYSAVALEGVTHCGTEGRMSGCAAWAARGFFSEGLLAQRVL